MPKTIKNKFDEKLTYENLMKAHIESRKGKGYRKEIIYSNGGTKGLPIGNYTSQIFANIYLNEQDQYVKHKLKCKYYFRYMDDSIILVKTKQEAKKFLAGHMGYIKIANTKNLEEKLFYM